MWGPRVCEETRVTVGHHLTDAMTRFARTFLGDYDVGEVLYELSETVVDVLDVDAAGVAIADADRLEFVTATNERSIQLERLQCDLQDGPCTDAWRSRQPVLVSDLETVRAWPAYRPGALEAGVRAVAALPLTAGDQTVGALDAYSATIRQWDAATVSAGRVLADMATLYIVHTRQTQDARTLNERLQHALDARVVVEQAKGVIAQRHGNVDTALERLRSHARTNRQPVHEVARRIVDGALRL